jgi:hypothetical protein
MHSLGSQVMAPGRGALRSFAVGRRDEQLVRPEKPITGTTNGNIQNIEDGCIKRLGSGKVAQYQLDVIDQSSAVKFLRFHAVLLLIVYTTVNTDELAGTIVMAA